MKIGLIEGFCNVKFIKANGEFRDMCCTLNEFYIPPEDLPKNPAKEVVENTSVIRVFDIRAMGWRSFRVDSVQEFLVDIPIPATTSFEV